jgi:hypothetical protein
MNTDELKPDLDKWTEVQDFVTCCRVLYSVTIPITEWKPLREALPEGATARHLLAGLLFLISELKHPFSVQDIKSLVHSQDFPRAVQFCTSANSGPEDRAVAAWLLYRHLGDSTPVWIN